MKYINRKKQLSLIGLFIGMSLSLACKKVLDVAEPIAEITPTKIFSSDPLAMQAADGMYYNLANTGPLCIATGGPTVLAGMGANELIPFAQDGNSNYISFYQDNLVSTNSWSNNVWNTAYVAVYDANAILSGLAASNKITDSVKNELTGEAEFVRAFSNFYLTTLYGDIPLVNTINWQQTNLLGRSKSALVYAQILSDLKDAQLRLKGDYSVGSGQRIVPNHWAATALLARVYLYMGNYADAYTQSDAVIANTGLFQLAPDVNSIFLINSPEAIWQLQEALGINESVTPEGLELIPTAFNAFTPPRFYLTTNLLNAFEPGDQRKSGWIDSTSYFGTKYYYAYKYKDGATYAATGADPQEYYMVLRLSEQYLIRAEAQANGAGGGLSGAIADMNKIRNRAGLPNYAGDAGSKSAVMAGIMHEDQIEFCFEWGHRWFDLKRWGAATQVLSAEKGLAVSQNALLWPIPQSEGLIDPNLGQNPGYGN